MRESEKFMIIIENDDLGSFWQVLKKRQLHPEKTSEIISKKRNIALA